MRRLECMVELGLAQMQFRIDHAIWKHTPFGQYGKRGNYDTALLYAPRWPERCPECDCRPIAPISRE